MATYSLIGTETGNTVERTLAVDESSIYGSSRLGTLKREQWIARNTYDLTTGTPVATNYSTSVPDQYVKDQYRGDKNYELSNHLGNVLVTVSDRRTPEYTLGMFSRFNANVSSAQDYYSFGMIQPGRSFGSTVYKFGFNGKLKDDEWTENTGATYDYGMRIYDSRIGRFLSVDPLTSKSPSETPYMFAGDNPIFYIDKNGLIKWETKQSETDYPMITLYLSKNIEKDITENQVIMGALIEHGETTDAFVRKTAKYGAYPAMRVTPGEKMLGASGQYERKIGTYGLLDGGGTGTPSQSFAINKEMLDDLEGYLRSDEYSEEEKQARLLNTFSTILDEYTHYLQNQNSKYKSEPEHTLYVGANGESTYDQGTKTEIDVYGEDVDLENAPKIVKKGENLPTLPDKPNK